MAVVAILKYQDETKGLVKLLRKGKTKTSVSAWAASSLPSKKSRSPTTASKASIDGSGCHMEKKLLKITHENLIGTLNFYSRKIFKKDYHYFFQWEENAFKWKIQLMYFGLHGLIKWNQNKSSSEQRVPVTLTVGKKKYQKILRII